MTVRELNREQLDELKVMYVCELYENPTWGDLADAKTICDEELFIHYKDIDFVEDDFSCGKEGN